MDVSAFFAEPPLISRRGPCCNYGTVSRWKWRGKVAKDVKQTSASAVGRNYLLPNCFSQWRPVGVDERDMSPLLSTSVENRPDIPAQVPQKFNTLKSRTLQSR